MGIRGCPCVPGQRAGHSRKVLKAVVGHVLWDLTQAGDVTGLPSPDPDRRPDRIRPDCAATSPTFAIASGARPGSQTTRAARGKKEAERDLIEALLGDYHGEPLSEIQQRPRGPGDPHRGAGI